MAEKRARCPKCGSRAESCLYVNPYTDYQCSNDDCTAHNWTLTPRDWNWLATKVRKGRMFEWLEQFGKSDYGKTGEVCGLFA